MKKLLGMLPFLKSEEVCELAKECISNNVDLDILQILPFMDEKDVDALFNQFRKENGELDLTFVGKNVNLNAMMPFLSQQLADDLFLNQANGKINTDVLPFVSEEALHTLVVRYAENPDVDLDIDQVYPFLSEKDISLLFKTYLNRHKKSKQSE